MAEKTYETRASIIESIKSPLGLFALVVLVIEAILLTLAVKAEAADRTVLIIGMLSTLMALVIGVFVIVWRKPELLLGSRESLAGDTEIEWTYDAFVSAPMAAFHSDAKAYQKSRSDVLRLVGALRESYGQRRVFYAGESLPNARTFEAADLSLESDLKVLHESRCFILIYPKEMATSALIEAGVAIGLRKPVLIHVLNGVELPFLLQHELGATKNHGGIHIYKYANFNEVLRVYRNNPQILHQLDGSSMGSPT